MTRDEQIAEAKRLHAAGLSIRRIERALGGPGRMTVWRWVNGAHDGSGARAPRSSKGRFMKIPEVEGDGPIYPDIDPGDKDALIARLRLENDILRGVNEILKGASLRGMANSQKATLIDHLRRTTSRPLKELTASLRISKSSYEYQRRAWRGATSTPSSAGWSGTRSRTRGRRPAVSAIVKTTISTNAD